MTNEKLDELIEEIESLHRWHLEEKGLTDFGCYDEWKRHSIDQRVLLSRGKTALLEAKKWREALGNINDAALAAEMLNNFVSPEFIKLSIQQALKGA